MEAEPAYLAIWLPGQILGGVAIGLMLPSIAAAAVSRLPPEQWGTGSAVNSALRQLGIALGVALAVALVGSEATRIEPFRNLYGSLVACGGVIGAIAWRLRGTG